MRQLGGLGVLLLLACGHFVRQVAPAVPYAEASDSLILAGLEYADLVILGTPDSTAAEGGAMSGLAFHRDFWWNVRITVDSVIKGKLSRARAVDYDNLPQWMIPPRPFKLAPNQIIVQQGTGAVTAPMIVGVRSVLFLRKCFRCVELPGRTDRRQTASPWFAVLALTPDHWARVKELRGA